MWTRFLERIPKELANLPFLMLQATALVGILSIMLIVYRKDRHESFPSPTTIGLVLGITGYALTALVIDFIQVPVKVYLRNDILFLAGYLGGWRGGAIGGLLVVVARFQFGGLTNGLAAFLDMSAFSLAGIAMYYALRRSNYSGFGLRQILSAWGVRTVVGLLSLVSIEQLGLVDTMPADLLISRIAFAIPSLVLFAGIMIIFRIDAENRRIRRWQYDQARLDTATQLPNRRSLSEHLDKRFQLNPNQPNILIAIEVANYLDMIRSQGLEWNDRFWRHITVMLNEERVVSLLAPYQPSTFLFSDAALVIIVHGLELAEVERSGLAMEIYRDISLRLNVSKFPTGRCQLRLSVAECDRSRYPTAEASLRDIGLRLHTVSHPERQHLQPPVRYLNLTIAETVAQEERMLSMLMQWIDNNEAPLAYQPKCDLRSSVVVGAEALLRAVDIDGRSIPPPRIVNLAANRQILSAFEWATVHVVARDARRCANQGISLNISVNISGASLTTVGFAERLRDLLSTFELSSDSLTLEVTESSPLPDVESVRENIRLLTELQIPLSLDDFGSGYSSLTVLARIPFTEVKIDQSMVAMIGDARMNSAIELALESAQRYGATFVAEGVETREQAEALTTMGVDIGQGYLFARAIPFEHLLEYARDASFRGDSVKTGR